ncbi:hypothetical protein DPMN_054419 [Dreissena polymorpha]|uniref:Uncharacterized protein n=1 Tax=Dreissena polymorpha TaxID=45954 RepID=A0A9D4CNV2_DREPO|nr:hypothetical protein DPMN_054419 [Dreissena polymorpha]
MESSLENVTPSIINVTTVNVTLSDKELLDLRLGDRHMSTVALVVLNIIYIAIFVRWFAGEYMYLRSDRKEPVHAHSYKLLSLQSSHC